MQFALRFQHGGESVHKSEIDSAWQNIQDYLCQKSERLLLIFKVKSK